MENILFRLPPPIPHGAVFVGPDHWFGQLAVEDRDVMRAVLEELAARHTFHCKHGVVGKPQPVLGRSPLGESTMVTSAEMPTARMQQLGGRGRRW